MHQEPEWRLELSPDALDAYCARDGSIVAALTWVENVSDGRLGEAWNATGPLLRLALTRHWCWNRRFELHRADLDPLEVAAALADDDGPAHPLWPVFAAGQRPREPAGSPAGGVWVASAPAEPIGPDLEVVELSFAVAVAGEGRGPSLTLLLRLGASGWEVAGHGRVPMKVGWPPCQR